MIMCFLIETFLIALTSNKTDSYCTKGMLSMTKVHI
jgi:hypothetical protein